MGVLKNGAGFWAWGRAVGPPFNDVGQAVGGVGFIRDKIRTIRTIRTILYGLCYAQLSYRPMAVPMRRNRPAPFFAAFYFVFLIICFMWVLLLARVPVAIGIVHSFHGCSSVCGSGGLNFFLCQPGGYAFVHCVHSTQYAARSAIYTVWRWPTVCGVGRGAWGGPLARRGAARVFRGGFPGGC